jgi:hypothetical protein
MDMIADAMYAGLCISPDPRAICIRLDSRLRGKDKYFVSSKSAGTSSRLMRLWRTAVAGCGHAVFPHYEMPTKKSAGLAAR